MQDWKEWTEVRGTPIETDRAWRRFADWTSTGNPVGMWYISQPSRFLGFGTLRSARNGAIQFQAETARATFDLKEARFTFGPMQTWPRWPNPPIVEMMALQVYLPRGAWLVMVEGLRPEAIPVPQLAE